MSRPPSRGRAAERRRRAAGRELARAQEQRSRHARRAVLLADLVLVVTLLAWAGSLLAVASLQSRTERGWFPWGFATATPGLTSVSEFEVAREDLVMMTGAVLGIPLALAVAGAVRTRQTRGGFPRTVPSRWSVSASAGVVMLVPGVLGCFFVAEHLGSTDLLLLPTVWPWLVFFPAYLGAGRALDRHVGGGRPGKTRRGPTRRTLSGSRVPRR